MHARPTPAREIDKARIRLVIESVFSTLKRQMRMKDHLAKTLPGLAQRIVQRLLALTLSMLINTILARPPCDGAKRIRTTDLDNQRPHSLAAPSRGRVPHRTRRIGCA